MVFGMGKAAGWFGGRKIRDFEYRQRRRIELGPEPPKYPIYAIGDVHGCLAELQAAEARIAADIQATRRPGLTVLLGDYVDRGLCSAQVLEHLIAPSRLGLKRVPLCGNHDDLFLRFINDPESHFDWLKMGGEQTLVSYGIDLDHLPKRHKQANARLIEIMEQFIPASHRKLLANLPVSLKIGELFFVHAGVFPTVPIEEQAENDLMWIREPFLTEGPKLPLLVVHGHTPNTNVDFGPGRIGIDTGAFYSGRLTVLKIDRGEAFIL